ncbi:hypothetical protein HDU85_004033 [Gaertneriomyces sp. JEL0708]|nr:hypothetical protein HDU85_004033 [Gaertneriomyces sp. JEL0708]
MFISASNVTVALLSPFLLSGSTSTLDRRAPQDFPELPSLPSDFPSLPSDFPSLPSDFPSLPSNFPELPSLPSDFPAPTSVPVAPSPTATGTATPTATATATGPTTTNTCPNRLTTLQSSMQDCKDNADASLVQSVLKSGFPSQSEADTRFSSLAQCVCQAGLQTDFVPMLTECKEVAVKSTSPPMSETTYREQLEKSKRAAGLCGEGKYLEVARVMEMSYWVSKDGKKQTYYPSGETSSGLRTAPAAFVSVIIAGMAAFAYL